MTYNLDFLVAGLVVLVLIWVHYISRDRIENMNSRMFQIFIAIGITDIALDIWCSQLIMLAEPRYRYLLLIMTTCLYLMQVAVSYALFYYIKSLCPAMQNAGQKMKLLDIPAIAMSLMVIWNLWSGVLFYVNRNGEYVRGPMYIAMYLYALLYGVIILIGSIIHRRTLGRRKRRIIHEFLVIMALSVGVQALRSELLMTGFGIGLGIAVMYLTLNNPCEYIDAQTRVFNLSCFVDWVRETMEKRERFHVIVVELSQIKKVNKLYGAGFGDLLLCTVAKKLRVIAESPYVFRISGKKFAVVTQSLVEYEKVRDRMEWFFRNPLVIEEEEIRFPAVLCGIMNAEELMDSDDLLFYIEYLIGLVPADDETRLVQGDDRTMQGLRYTKSVEKYMNEAIEKDLFEVYYQPVYSLEKEQFITLEALSRLRHPSLGPVSPEVFIDIAEKNGRITEVSYLQFRRVCRFLKENPDVMKTIVNVKFNLSPLELVRAGYSRKLIQVIEEFELPYGWFQFEITETVATEYSDRLLQAVEDFTACGIGLCLDDFGSGYANLDTVLRLPFSSIKIDRSLIAGIAEDLKRSLFYRNIVNVLQNLGYNVIAEGVEEQKEEKLLRAWGVNMIQGYYYAKPMPEKALLELLKNGQHGRQQK